MAIFASVLALSQEGGSWTGEGHGVSRGFLELSGWIGSWALLLVFLFLLVRALVRDRRYRATRSLNEADLGILHAEIRSAEKKTVGEILPVVVERSDPHPGARWTSALLTLLLGSVLLAGWLPWDHPSLVLLAQLALGAVGWLAAHFLPDYQRLFIRAERASKVCEEQAFQEFHAHELRETEGRTGVLIFVSLLEHRVIVLADVGIDAKVGEDTWSRVDRAILEGVREGRLREGLVAGIRECARVLQEHFPWEEGDRNEIPDRVIVRRE